jgi:hypothetical protein
MEIVPKYNIVIQTMIKDEEHILNEWICHHILLGIEHIYIYDDNSIIPVTTTLSSLPSWIIDKVTVYRLEEEDSNYFDDTFTNSKYFNYELYNNKSFRMSKQCFFLNYFVKNHTNISKWCWFCDADEFIYLKDKNNIRDFLIDYDNYNIINIPWLIYGSSYYIEQPKGLIMENFRMHQNHYCPIGKSIAKLSELKLIYCPHELHDTNKALTLWSKETNCFETPCFELDIHINHYQINSVKKYLLRKLDRNEIGYFIKNRPAKEIFLFVINYNSTKTYIMDKYIDKIKMILQINNTNNKNNENNKSNDFIDAFCINNNKYVGNVETYDILYEMLNSTSLRFCNINELKYILNENTPEDFDPKIYRELNLDLKNLNDTAVKRHYNYTGYKENRKYKYENITEVFNPNTYKELNEDLKDMNNLEAKLHYEIYGYKENRKYNI